MIEPPQITQTAATQTATIRLKIPRDQIRDVMEPAIKEVMSTLQQQGVAAAGPLFSHHFKTHPDTFDFEVGVPVSSPIAPAGRVEPSTLPAARVARTVYHGPYEGLGAAWGEFGKWIESEGLTTAANLWEFYTAGPESSSDPANWRTELNRPLTG